MFTGWHEQLEQNLVVGAMTELNELKRTVELSSSVFGEWASCTKASRHYLGMLPAQGKGAAYGTKSR